MALSVSPRVEMFYSGIWNNVTTLVRTDPAIQITRGALSEDGQDTPSTCTYVLNNGDGRFSPRNPTSPLYGLIGRNTQTRVGLGLPPIGASTAVVTASTSLVAPSVTAEATGIQFVAWATYPTNDITLPGGFTAVDAELDAGSTLTVAMARKAISAGATGTATATAVAAGTAYAAATVALAGATFVGVQSGTNASGADANATRSLTAGNFALLVTVWSEDSTDRMQVPKIGGANFTVTPPDQGARPFLITDSGAPATVQTPRVRVWGFWVPSTASYTFSLAGQHDGVSTTTSTFSIVEFSGVSAYYPRFVGEISEFPVEWAKRGSNAWTAINSAGVSRRLASANQESAGSAIYESFVRNRNVVAYWPMEDGENATSFGSGLGGTTMGFAPGGASGNARPLLAASSELPGSKPMPTFTQAGGIGVVPSYGLKPGGSGEEVSFGCIVGFNPAGSAVGANIMRAEFTGGSLTGVLVEWTSNTTYTLKADFSDGTASSSNLFTVPSPGWSDTARNIKKWYMAYFQLKQNGAAVDGFFAFTQIDPSDGVTAPSTQVQSLNFASKTLGKVRRLLIGVEATTGNTLHSFAPVFGHAFVANAFNPFQGADPYTASSAWALTAWNGQKVSDQLYRLAADNNTLIGVRHNDTDAVLGYQQIDTVYAQLRDAAHTGLGGQLSDAAGYAGYVWADRIYKENSPPRLTFVYGNGVLQEPLLPIDDDLLTRNDITASRRGGGSSRVVKTTGSLSVLKPPLGVGRYVDQQEFSLQLDSQADDFAGWLLNAGTVDEPRWPQIAFNLAHPNNASKIDTMKYFAIGDSIRITGMPVWVAPGAQGAGATDLKVNGYTEFIGFETWLVTMNCSSTTPFFSAIVEPSGAASTAGADRVGDDGFSSLVSSVTSSATSLSVATSSGALWTTAAGDLSLRIFVAGEEMSVTALTGATSPQTFTVTRSVNGVSKAQSAGAVVTTPAPIIGL